jgi:hypothetical protein
VDTATWLAVIPIVLAVVAGVVNFARPRVRRIRSRRAQSADIIAAGNLLLASESPDAHAVAATKLKNTAAEGTELAGTRVASDVGTLSAPGRVDESTLPATLQALRRYRRWPFG